MEKITFKNLKFKIKNEIILGIVLHVPQFSGHKGPASADHSFNMMLQAPKSRRLSKRSGIFGFFFRFSAVRPTSQSGSTGLGPKIEENNSGDIPY